MALTTIYTSREGTVTSANPSATGNFLFYRNATTGTSSDTYTSDTTVQIAINTQFASGRPGSVTIERTFLFFDTSAVAGTITACTLGVLGASPYSNQVDSIIVEATAWGGTSSPSLTLSTADYDELSFSTPYSSQLTTWTNSNFNLFTLNSTAIADMNSNNYLNLAVIEHDYDYLGVTPSSGTNDRAGINFQSSTKPIYLDITYTPGGYGNNVNGVSSTNIGEVNGVSSTNIGEIIGV
tara:strand:+ start:562 stop:1275 length:714 start_codon:yes stop_codon:yes gene_type:complete